MTNFFSAWLVAGGCGYAGSCAMFAAPLVLAVGAIRAPAIAPLKTLKEQERDYILVARARIGGRVSGAQGAALLLDINPNTRQAQMKMPGIRRTVG